MANSRGVKLAMDTQEKRSARTSTQRGLTSSEKQPQASARLKSARLANVISHRRKVLLKPLRAEGKIAVVRRWLERAAPGELTGLCRAIQNLIVTTNGLAPVAEVLQDLIGETILTNGEIYPYDALNHRPHWGTFFRDADVSQNAGMRRLLVCQVNRLDIDVNSSEWKVYDPQTNMVLTLDMRYGRLESPTPVEQLEVAEETEDLRQIKAGMKTELANRLQVALQSYLDLRFPQQDSYAGGTVRRGRVDMEEFVVEEGYEISIAIGSQFTKDVWSGKWMSSWEVIIDCAKPKEMRIEGVISTFVSHHFPVSFHSRQKKSFCPVILPTDLNDSSATVQAILDYVERLETKTQIATTEWLGLWRQNSAWNAIYFDAFNPVSSLTIAAAREPVVTELTSALAAQFGAVRAEEMFDA